MELPRSKQQEFSASLRLISPEFYVACVSDYIFIRSVKLWHRADGSWSCVLGGYGSEFEPMVFFGTGESIYGALRDAERGRKSGKGKPDEYANEGDFAYGEVLAREFGEKKHP